MVELIEIEDHEEKEVRDHGANIITMRAKENRLGYIRFRI